MTESEAKQKWCPMRQKIFQATRNTLDEPTTQETNCIGSACMMWRWDITESRAAEINASCNAGAAASGYCGLAGKP